MMIEGDPRGKIHILKAYVTQASEVAFSPFYKQPRLFMKSDLTFCLGHRDSKMKSIKVRPLGASSPSMRKRQDLRFFTCILQCLGINR